MSEHDTEVVWLSDLRFADLKPKEHLQTNRTEGVSDKASATKTHQEQTGLPGIYPQYNESRAYDRLAADKPGEELTAEATIWKLYVSEAEDYDDELVDRQHRNIDVMLVFAALFSAILASFLLDSQNMMQQDPSDITNMLLKRIAQRLEYPNSPFQPVELPGFEPIVAARWINGLWFTSLALSLAAALLAMLAKEWLTTFASSRPRQAYSYAIDRQARLDALSSWGAMLLIDHLPLLLHIALLLFAVGLILYLYSTVDVTVASVVTVITGATLLFYTITTGLATLYEVCPFDTQLSLYSRRLLKFIVSHWEFAERYKRHFDIKGTKSPERTTKQDLHALRWLVKHARDPRVGESAYQALAGLRLRDTETSVASTTPNSSLLAPKNGAHKKSGRKLKLVTSMFVDICHRLNQARTGNSQDLTLLFGTNVARYVSTLSHFVGYMLRHLNQERLTEHARARIAKIGAELSEGKEKPFDPAKTALEALDSILHDECPPFTADAYAWITAGELTLTTAIAGAIENQKDTASSSTKEIGGTLSEDLPAGAVSVNTQTRPETAVGLFDLRARYSRSLTRASFQLMVHAEGTAPMSASSLIYLLNSIGDAAKFDSLNPSTSLSTHHPQDPRKASVLPTFYIALIGSGLSYSLDPGVIGNPDGILGGILNVLGASGTSVAGVESAAGSALQAVAPLLLKQWLHFPNVSNSELLNFNEGDETEVSITLPPPNFAVNAITLSTNRWPSEQSLDEARITTWVLSQILHLAAFAKFYSDRPGVDQLLALSLRAFNRRSVNCYPKHLPAEVAMEDIFIVQYLVRIDDYELVPTQGRDSISDYLLQLLAFKDNKNETVYSRLFTLGEIQPSHLFRLIENTSTSVTQVEILLADISKYGSRDLFNFTTSNGFSLLQQIAWRSEYVPAVVRCVFNLVTKAINPSFDQSSSVDQPYESDQEQVMLAASDVEAFLDSVGFALKHPLPIGKRPSSLAVFLLHFSLILESLQASEDAQHLSKHLPRTELENNLHNELVNSESKEIIISILEKFKVEDDQEVTGMD